MDRVTLAAMGGELRARRQAREITRAALAEAVGSRPVIIGRWERGEAVPTAEQARALVRVLELDPREAADWEAAAQSVALAGPEPVAEARWAGPRRRLAARWKVAVSSLGGRRPVEEPGGQAPDAAGRSYLDDPAEQRRYARRWALTLAILAALAVALIWALGELADGWRALVELFRSGPATDGPAGALRLLVSL
jgi:transcriptional regulator with XRE-family HTH domain